MKHKLMVSHIKFHQILCKNLWDTWKITFKTFWKLILINMTESQTAQQHLMVIFHIEF
jgi:hypothetical protein